VDTKRAQVLKYAIVALLGGLAILLPTSAGRAVRGVFTPQLDFTLIILLGLAGSYEVLRALRGWIARRTESWEAAAAILLGVGLLILSYALLPSRSHATPDLAQSIGLGFLVVASLVYARAQRAAPPGSGAGRLP